MGLRQKEHSGFGYLNEGSNSPEGQGKWTSKPHWRGRERGSARTLQATPRAQLFILKQWEPLRVLIGAT